MKFSTALGPKSTQPSALSADTSNVFMEAGQMTDQTIDQIIGQTIGQTRDIFSAECPPGQVIGTQSTEGLTRQGADVEKVISIDNEALRIQPLVNPGWGRAGIVYGPYARVPGLALSVFMLNGHNTSPIKTRHAQLGLVCLRRYLGGLCQVSSG